MPDRPPRPCSYPGCPALVKDGSSRCPEHTVKRASNWRKVDQSRPGSTARGYGWKWQQVRLRYLRTHPRCTNCGHTATVIDHITPHRGDQALFWDRTNWQPLCLECHSRKTAGGG